MYILSQDKKNIVVLDEVGVISVQRNFTGGKDAKFCIVANVSGIILGTYPEEKTAIVELEHIMQALEAGQTTYRMGII